ncbi:MAG: hypothetical protein RL122_1818 [Pseudomonadota bacterium]|jgi:hypothetical protein
MLPNTPHVQFVIPGLWQPLALWRKDFNFRPVAPSLLRLCADHRPAPLAAQGLENTLFHLKGHTVTTEIPFAYHRYRLDFGVPPALPLLCADPVFLKSGLDSVVMQPALPLLPADELATLLALLNHHLAEDGLQLVAKHPQRWYLMGERVQGDVPLQTVPLSQALGQSIFPLLPQGDKRYWHRLLNEIQMLLHTRENPAVNALWLWGAAYPASLPALQTDEQQTFVGESVTAQVMALATAVRYQAATQFADVPLTTGHYTVVLEELHPCSVADDLQGWQQALAQLETAWFAPALRAMQSGQCSISVTACDGRLLHCQRPSPWKFWGTPSATWEQLS